MSAAVTSEQNPLNDGALAQARSELASEFSRLRASVEQDERTRWKRHTRPNGNGDRGRLASSCFSKASSGCPRRGTAFRPLSLPGSGGLLRRSWYTSSPGRWPRLGPSPLESLGGGRQRSSVREGARARGLGPGRGSRSSPDARSLPGVGQPAWGPSDRGVASVTVGPHVLPWRGTAGLLPSMRA